MDRSLWLLLFLRSRGWLRRHGKTLRSLKGALLALVGSLVFLPMIVSALLTPRMGLGPQLEPIRRHGPLGLMAYCVLNLLLSAGDRAIYYSPAEVNVLFSGPYRQRQVLLYKIVTGTCATALTAVFMSLMLAQHAARFSAAVIGLFLSLELLYLFSLSVGMIISTVGALAYSRGRRLILLMVLGAVGLSLASVGEDALSLGFWPLVTRLEEGRIMQVVLAPFRPFILAFTAERLWPDLAKWSALAFLVDAALLGSVLALNHEYLEALAVASARHYTRIRRLKGGGAWDGRPRFLHVGLPDLPWWGGIGPNAWRQAITAVRSGSRLAAIVFFFLFPTLMFLWVTPLKGEYRPALIVVGVLSLAASTMAGFDFHPDLDRMETLKTLPIRPVPLVLGQLFVPTTILTVAQWIVIGVIASMVHVESVLLVAVCVIVVPVNALLVEIENLFLLWYPVRLEAGNSADFQTMGRMMLLMMAKFTCIGIGAVAAAAIGAGCFFLFGQSWTAAVASGWIVITLFAMSLVPLVAQAFTQFDVSRDLPE